MGGKGKTDNPRDTFFRVRCLGVDGIAQFGMGAAWNCFNWGWCSADVAGKWWKTEFEWTFERWKGTGSHNGRLMVVKIWVNNHLFILRKANKHLMTLRMSFRFTRKRFYYLSIYLFVAIARIFLLFLFYLFSFFFFFFPGVVSASTWLERSGNIDLCINVWRLKMQPKAKTEGFCFMCSKSFELLSIHPCTHRKPKIR